LVLHDTCQNDDEKESNCHPNSTPNIRRQLPAGFEGFPFLGKIDDSLDAGE
jgi:hypothetical protein